MVGRKRVLIVEDDRIVKNSLERLLRESGCDVESAFTGEEGLEKFTRQPSDLVLTDLKLPGMDGLEMITRMRELQDTLPFIVLSAYGEVDDALKALKLGAVEFCQKPFDAQQVLNLAKKHIHNSLAARRAKEISPRKNGHTAETTMKTTSTVDRVRSAKTTFSPELLHLLTLLAPYVSLGRQGTGITHNLNGPLTGMMGHVELMIMKHPELSDDLEVVINLAKKLRDMIAGLQVKHENETLGEIQPQDVNEILRAELAYLNSDLFFKHYIEKECDFQKTIPTIKGTYANFALAFEEILINAIDQQRDQKNGWLSVKTYSDVKSICVVIEDQGPGFTANALENAFEPFWPEIKVLEDGRIHAGMGLFLSRLWLEPYGGKIELDNRKPNGARVRIILPLLRDAMEE